MPTARPDTASIASGADLWAGRNPGIYGNARIAIWGQSNALGRASRSEISASPLSSDVELADYDDGTLPFSRVMIWTGSVFATLQPGVNSGADTADFGPEFGLAVRWMRETTSGTLYIDKNAASALSITSFEPEVGARWTTGITERGQQNDWLAANGVTIDAEYLLWNQGEADYLQTQAWYQPRLQALLDALETANYISASSKVVLSQIPVESIRDSAELLAAKAAIADASGGRINDIMQPAYLEVDNIHYNGRGQVQHAYDVFAFFFNASTITV